MGKLVKLGLYKFLRMMEIDLCVCGYTLYNLGPRWSILTMFKMVLKPK